MPIRHIICVPTFGSPYLVASVSSNKTDDYLKATQECVGGSICEFPKKDFVIHPMFCSEDKRWDMARQMLTSGRTKVWVNENGYNEQLCGNTGTIITNPNQRIGGCPHILGDVCVDVPDTVMTALGFRADCFALVEENYEPYDEAELEAKKTECVSKGWDYDEHSGQIYKAVC